MPNNTLQDPLLEPTLFCLSHLFQTQCHSVQLDDGENDWLSCRGLGGFGRRSEEAARGNVQETTARAREVLQCTEVQRYKNIPTCQQSRVKFLKNFTQFCRERL